MDELILRNMESAQYIYGAKKNFLMRHKVLSESHSKILIGHFSDIHSDLVRFDHCLKFFEYFGVDFAIHTGDTVVWDMRDDCRFLEEADQTTSYPIYNCIGNHDTFKDKEPVSNEALHEALLARLKNIQAPNNRGYYHVDFDAYKLRLVILNNYDFDREGCGSARKHYHISQEQCNWLVKILKEAAENGYAIIIASHECDIPVEPGSNDLGFCQRFKPYPWYFPKDHEHVVADIVDAFRHGKELKLDFTWEETGVRIQLDEKFEIPGEFICYLNGHRHGDFVGFLPGFPDQLSIGMPCSGCYPEGFHNIGEEVSDLPRIPGTVSEDCVNFYTIDREKRTISIVRVGAVVNDELKLRRALQLTY